MVHAGAVFYLFLSIGDTGKFLSRNTKHCKSSEFLLKAEITTEFLGQNSTPNPIRCQLGSQLRNSYLARKLELFAFLAWCCCLRKGVAISCQVGQQG